LIVVEFESDENALRSILDNTGVVVAPLLNTAANRIPSMAPSAMSAGYGVTQPSKPSVYFAPSVVDNKLDKVAASTAG
jgi:hypothetical protein